MTVEHELTRELDIRFIDARSIVNEAKVSLSIHGYTTQEQELKIRNEALRIFRQRPASSKDTMRRLSSNLEAVKGSSMEFSDVESCDSVAFSEASSLASSRRSSLFRFGRR